MSHRTDHAHPTAALKFLCVVAHHFSHETGHCPSGDDPNTDADETDCFGVVAAGGRGIGKQGNLCHVECSNHGTCSYKSGECECFAGYKGVACSKRTFE
jgi:hypothetical protein